MFNDSVSFNGGTRVEVVAVLANCGRDTDRARQALVTWIRHKQHKGRSTEHILAKLRDIESKFIKDTSLHNAFRDARALTFLPRPPDLPLPDCIRKRSGSQVVPEYAHSPSAPTYPRPSSMSSSISEELTQVNSPQSPSLRSSRSSSQTSDFSWGKSNTSSAGRPPPQPQGLPRISESRSPPIQIPRTLRPGPSSPISSSPEEAGVHLRYHHLSRPIGPPHQSHSPVAPHSASSPDPPVPFRRQNSNSRCYAPHEYVPPEPSPRTQAPRPRPRRSIYRPPGTPSSEESESRPQHPHMARSAERVSPGRSRVTPPRTNPPDVPLPPVPSDDQGMHSNDGTSNKSLLMEQPPTPVRSLTMDASTPVRPLPIQPIPSPIPGSEEWEQINTVNGNSLQQYWHGSSGELPLMRAAARQDSPVFAFHEDRASYTGIGPPPPYLTPLDTHSPLDVPTIGDKLDRAVEICGGSQEVRHEVYKCIKFYRGYEPPYWQTRLQACGLNAEAAKYLVDEMSKQVDWASSFSRAS